MIKQANFIGSFTRIGQCPADGLPEYAFIGRSNVGKSSLINMLTGRKKLAMVSHTPGKTKTINYFRIDDSWFLVDLPGYGYAKVSKSDRFAWDRMIRAYLANRNTLSCVFVLIDSRIPPQRIDIEFLNWLGEMGIPFVIVFTKTDKLKKNQRGKQVNAFLNVLGETWETLPDYFMSSAVSSEGKEDILRFILQVNASIKS